MVEIKMTESQLLALTDLVAQHLVESDHTEVYIDVVRQVETLADDLLLLLMDRSPAVVRSLDTTTPEWTFTEYGSGGGKAVVVLTADQAAEIKQLLNWQQNDKESATQTSFTPEDLDE